MEFVSALSESLRRVRSDLDRDKTTVGVLGMLGEEAIQHVKIGLAWIEAIELCWKLSTQECQREIFIPGIKSTHHC